MQQYHQQLTMVTSFGLLFRPSSDYASFGITEKPYNRLNVKMGRDLTPLKSILIKQLKRYEEGEKNVNKVRYASFEAFAAV